MIPWFQYEKINTGFLTLNVWGILVSLGFLAGIAVVYFRAKKNKLEAHRILDLAFWVIIASMIGGRLLYVAEHLNVYLTVPSEIFKLWHGGMSVYGGFVGAILAFIFFTRYHKLDFWQYADTVIFGLPLGLFVGRLGCFFIHDHPGVGTNFFLGVEYPDGGHFDLGLLLSLNGLVIFILFFLLDRREWFVGFYTAFFAAWYGLARFFLDFLRVNGAMGADPRYFGLTLAQYLSVIVLATGIYLFFSLRKSRNVPRVDAGEI